MTKHSQSPDVGGTGRRASSRLAEGVRTMRWRLRMLAVAAWPVVRRWALLRPVQLAGMLLIGLLIGGGVGAAASGSDAKPSTTHPTPTNRESTTACDDPHKPSEPAKPADPTAPDETGKPKPPAPSDHPRPHTPPKPPGGR